MIRNEIVGVKVDNTSIYPSDLQITMGVGKGYNTCSLTGTDMTANVGQTLVVTINTINFTFLIDSKNYGKNNEVSLDCIGTPATLEDDSVSEIDYAYADSNELITLSSGVITVVNNIPNIVFSGQTYSKASTPMSRIMDMVRVIGGDAYEVDGTLHLDIIKSIDLAPTIAHTFSNPEVFNFSYSDNRDKTTKVNEVLFNPVTEDIYASPSVTLDFNDTTQRGEVFFNPSLSSGSTYTVDGLEHRPPTVSAKVEVITADASTYINTLGGIDSVTYITINGEPIPEADYVLYAGYNVVRFLTPKTGSIEINYITESVVVFAFAQTTFSIKYQCVACNGTIDINADNEILGSGFARIVQPLTYEAGGTVLLADGIDSTFIFVEERGSTNLATSGTLLLAGGGTLTIKYLYTSVDWVDQSFMASLSSATVSRIETFSSEVIFDSVLGLYVVYLDTPITSINDVYFGSSILSGYTYDGLGAVPYISFLAGDEGKLVDISMNVNYIEVTIPAPLVGHPVQLLDVITTGGVATERFVLSEDTLCSLPATFSIDVASMFGVEIFQCFGATLTGDLGNLVVDNRGFITVTITTPTLHTILADAVVENGTITIDAVGVI